MTENLIALEVAKIYNNSFMYRHNCFWNIFHKSMLAILGLISLPFFLHEQIKYYILIIFPALSILVCVFSMIILDSETIRMSLLKRKLNDLLKDHVSLNSVNYLEDRIKQELRNKVKSEKLSIWGF